MKNKDHILSLEFYKDHFKYQHDGSSTNISASLDLEEKGECKKKCITIKNIGRSPIMLVLKTIFVKF